ncbi:MAG: 4Fe-4S dicluster domain-containing protein [Desulfosalsimonas sp.]
MSKYYLFQDQKKCIGCMACVVACKSRQGLSRGPFPSLLVTIGPRWVGHLPRTAFTFMPCFHCENPWCVAACPTGAMFQRKQDGIVTVDPDLCVGCKTCISACPWGAPQWNQETGKAVKCDYCYDRVEAGLKPACVTVCPTQCLYFGTPDQIPEVRRERYARARAQDL